MFNTVEEYINSCKYKSGMEYLRKVILTNDKLIEECKWGKPCYCQRQVELNS